MYELQDFLPPNNLGLNPVSYKIWALSILEQEEAQLMLTTGSTRLAVSRGQQTWYHSTCYI